MAERIRKDKIALILAIGYSGPIDFRALGPDEQKEHIERMLNAVDALERSGHWVVPLSEI